MREAPARTPTSTAVDGKQFVCHGLAAMQKPPPVPSAEGAQHSTKEGMHEAPARIPASTAICGKLLVCQIPALQKASGGKGRGSTALHRRGHARGTNERISTSVSLTTTPKTLGPSAEGAQGMHEAVTRISTLNALGNHSSTSPHLSSLSWNAPSPPFRQFRPRSSLNQGSQNSRREARALWDHTLASACFGRAASRIADARRAARSP